VWCCDWQVQPLICAIKVRVLHCASVCDLSRQLGSTGSLPASRDHFFCPGTDVSARRLFRLLRHTSSFQPPWMRLCYCHADLFVFDVLGSISSHEGLPSRSPAVAIASRRQQHFTMNARPHNEGRRCATIQCRGGAAPCCLQRDAV
jgi:hypothetical protein